ncbi:MAG: PfkB family carbohydrate kinase [Planctomycetia bacterium]|nr:PfkB family carbohydrate kinase [Planctomycetia bacterium]
MFSKKSAVVLEKYHPNREQILSLLMAHRQPNIAVVGDYCLDKYLYIDPALDEPSVETGLTARQVRRTACYPGVGGTVTANLIALGAKVQCVGVRGNDGEGCDLASALTKLGANTDLLLVGDDLLTNTYIKPMEMLDEGNRELNRIDIRQPKRIPNAIFAELETKLASIIETVDAVIICDQFTNEPGSVVTDRFRKFLGRLGKRYPAIFFLGDSRSYPDRYQNILVKCNANEIISCYERYKRGEQPKNVDADVATIFKDDELLSAGKWLSERNDRPVLVTRGEKGSLLFQGDQATIIPPIRVRGQIDICGAGDATNAAFAFGRVIGLDLASAAWLANVVSSITIRQIGVTGTASMRQIRRVLHR